jgi:hypothetical protein
MTVKKVVVRYLPFTIFIVALVLVLSFVPSISKSTSSASNSSGTGSSNLSLPPGVTPQLPSGSKGLTVAGVKCAPGVRQIPWSKYAPECEPAWHGNNGGATAPGVTGSTITITYREFVSTDLSEIYSLLPKQIIGTNSEAVTTLKADIKVFNKYFELYGRHVVLKSFTGKGDLIQEMTGGDQAQAEADAVTAKSLGAFADMSLADTSEFYTSALADQHVIAFPLLYLQNRAAYRQEEPYIYTPGPDCDSANEAIAATVGNAMKGLPAVFAGDPQLKTKTRTFGIIYNDNPYAQTCESDLVNSLKTYNVSPAKVGSFNFTPQNLPEQIINIIEQMKAAGITTIIFADEDPVSPGLFMQQAQADNYHPEWLFLPSFTGGNIDADALNRHFASEAPQEMSHVIVPGIASSKASSQEDYKVFKLGAPPKAKPLPTYSLGWAYAPVMLLFSAIQQAGPDLTPTTFENAFHHLTDSAPNGMFGQWNFGPNIVDPAASFQLLWWDPNAISNQDGLKGAMEPCFSGKQFLFAKARQQIPVGSQLACFGSNG